MFHSDGDFREKVMIATTVTRQSVYYRGLRATGRCRCGRASLRSRCDECASIENESAKLRRIGRREKRQTLWSGYEI